MEGAAAAVSLFHPLSTADFARTTTLGPSARVLDTCVDAIVDAVEALRARAMGARHAFLVREFVTEARRAGLSVQSTLDRTLVVSAPGGGRVLVQPAIGVPDAERYETPEQMHQGDMSVGRTYSLPPVLLYDETGIRTRWLKHLNWLNAREFPHAAFEHVELIDAVQNDREASLLRMREAMLAEPFIAGIFIGGMEGVEDEYRMFLNLQPGIPAFPIASTGAAAGKLFAASPDLKREHPR